MNNHSRESSLSQVGMMETFSKVTISPQEREQYVLLREKKSSLSDQRLLAQIISSENHNRVVAFWSAYANIFCAELSETP